MLHRHRREGCLSGANPPSGPALESFGEYLAQTKERIGIDRALKTFKLRTYQLSLLREYVQKKHKVSDIPLSQLDKAFIEGFEYYLTIDRRLKRSSISSALSTLQTIVRMAVKKGVLDFYPFLGYSYERPKGEPRSITQDELQRIIDLKIEWENYRVVRDLFVFSCYTGLARVDMQRLKPKYIIHNADGTEEIRIKRQKTDVEAIIPLLPIAKQILSLYIKDKKADDLIFPNLTIRKASFACMNIGQICRIEKGLTFLTWLATRSRPRFAFPMVFRWKRSARCSDTAISARHKSTER